MKQATPLENIRTLKRSKGTLSRYLRDWTPGMKKSRITQRFMVASLNYTAWNDGMTDDVDQMV
jgi:hypothetical protein